MNPPDLFERVVVSLQEAALGKARWSEAALLINEISGTRGSALAFADGRAQADAHFLFMQLCHDGERREDLEREYFGRYWERDESIPRIGRLPDGALAPTVELYTDREKRKSPAWRRKSGRYMTPHPESPTWHRTRTSPVPEDCPRRTMRREEAGHRS